jgi:hypothetical protein
MSAAQNQYSIGLDKTPANYVALTPLSFLARTAAVYPDHLSTVYEGRSFTGRRPASAAGALRRGSPAAASATAIRWRRCCRISLP